MEIKINENRIVIDIVMLLPVATLIQAIWPQINRACFGMIIIAMFIIFVARGLSRQDFVILAITFLLYIWSLFMTESTAYNFNDYFYFLFYTVYFTFVVGHREDFISYCHDKKGYILNVIRLWNAVVLVSMFFSSSYTNGYFTSFTGAVFRLATSATFILALLTVVVPMKKRYIIYSILPMYSLLFGGSRTYLAVGLVIFAVLLYFVCGSKKTFILIMVPVGALMLFLIFNSSIMNKIDSTLTVQSTDFYQDPLIKFTSGRSLFWAADMKAFGESSLLNKLFGSGFNFVYDVNETAINNKIWAHNDYINVLLNFGITGLVIYIQCYIRMFRAFSDYLGHSKLLKFAIFFVWFFNAFFNMFYTYFCACASYPFLIIGVSEFLVQMHEKDKVDVYIDDENSNINYVSSEHYY